MISKNSNVYEDSGGGVIDEVIPNKSSFNRNKRDVENAGLEMSPRVSSLNKNNLSQKRTSHYHPYLTWRNNKRATEGMQPYYRLIF